MKILKLIILTVSLVTALPNAAHAMACVPRDPTYGFNKFLGDFGSNFEVFAWPFFAVTWISLLCYAVFSLLIRRIAFSNFIWINCGLYILTTALIELFVSNIFYNHCDQFPIAYAYLERLLAWFSWMLIVLGISYLINGFTPQRQKVALATIFLSLSLIFGLLWSGIMKMY